MAGGKNKMNRLLTRREIIKQWEDGEKWLDFFCCPNCRNVLTLHTNPDYSMYLRCDNHFCLLADKYEYFHSTAHYLNKAKEFFLTHASGEFQLHIRGEHKSFSCFPDAEKYLKEQQS
jgi:uncharacterized protein YbaR (Trm112 family)